MQKYIVVAALSVSASIFFLRSPGTFDVSEEWMPWMEILARSGLIDGYAKIADMYPPGAATMLITADWMLPMLPDLVVLGILLGVAQLAAGLVFAARTNTGLALGFVAAVTLSGAALKYLDILFAVPLCLSLFAALDRRPILSVTAFATACLIKWQPLILLPFMAVIWLEQARAVPLRRLAAAAAVLTAAIALIAIAFWPSIWRAFFWAMNDDPWSGNALNFAWLLQLVRGYTPDAIHTVPEKWRWALRIVFALVYLPLLAAAWRTRRKGPATTLAFAMAGFAAYYLFAPVVHENHLFVPMLTGFVLWASNPRFASAAIAMAVFANLNLLVFHGISGTGPFVSGDGFALLTGALSVAGIAAFCVGIFMLASATRTSVREL